MRTNQFQKAPARQSPIGRRRKRMAAAIAEESDKVPGTPGRGGFWTITGPGMFGRGVPPVTKQAHS